MSVRMRTKMEKVISNSEIKGDLASYRLLVAETGTRICPASTLTPPYTNHSPRFLPITVTLLTAENPRLPRLSTTMTPWEPLSTTYHDRRATATLPELAEDQAAWRMNASRTSRQSSRRGSSRTPQYSRPSTTRTEGQTTDFCTRRKWWRGRDSVVRTLLFFPPPSSPPFLDSPPCFLTEPASSHSSLIL